MADIKRLHYFNHQFLVEADFTDEQKYHLDMRRLHNRALHTFGVARGLEVVKAGDTAIRVTAGIAFDREGREIVLDTDHTLDLGDSIAYPAGSDIYVTIAYHEEETDESTATGAAGFTRVTERPQIQASISPPPLDGSVVCLCHIPLGEGQNIADVLSEVDDDDHCPNGVRQTAGTELADNSVTSVKIAQADGTTGQDTSMGDGIKTDHIQDGAVTNSKLASDSVTADKIVNGSVGTAELADGDVTNSKLANDSVTADKIVNGNVGTAKLDNGAVTTDKLQNNSVTSEKINFRSVGSGSITLGPGESVTCPLEGGIESKILMPVISITNLVALLPPTAGPPIAFINADIEYRGEQVRVPTLRVEYNVFLRITSTAESTGRADVNWQVYTFGEGGQ